VGGGGGRGGRGHSTRSGCSQRDQGGAYLDVRLAALAILRHGVVLHFDSILVHDPLRQAQLGVVFVALFEVLDLPRPVLRGVNLLARLRLLILRGRWAGANESVGSISGTQGRWAGARRSAGQTPARAVA